MHPGLQAEEQGSTGDHLWIASVDVQPQLFADQGWKGWEGVRGWGTGGRAIGLCVYRPLAGWNRGRAASAGASRPSDGAASSVDLSVPSIASSTACASNCCSATSRLAIVPSAVPSTPLTTRSAGLRNYCSKAQVPEEAPVRPPALGDPAA